MANALYICYFGLRQPLVQTQVLPYLRELTKYGHSITLLTFEPDLKGEWTTEQVRDTRTAMRADGIDWEHLVYHKRPSAIATAYDILRGAMRVRKIIAKKKIDILHGRVHVPTLMGALGRRFSSRTPKLLFDIRGFFPEEYTEAGIWPDNGLIYRSVKRIEKWLLKESDAFVVLTHKARQILFGNNKANGRPVEVIPCCVDLKNRFAIDQVAERTRMRAKMRLENRFVFVHAGALGGLYLTEQIADLLAEARRRNPSTFAMFLTQSDPELIVPLLKARGFGAEDYFVSKVPPDDVPAYLCAADAGLSFVKAGYATQSRSPTKIPEYLACGLPIIANSGVGDVDELVVDNGVGVVLESFEPVDFQRALERLFGDHDFAERCRETAKRIFDLETVGGVRYAAVYQALIK